MNPSAGRPTEIIINDPNASFFAGTQRLRLWEYLVPVGVELKIQNPFRLIAKLYGAGNVQIPASSKLYLARIRRGDFEIEDLAEIPYAPYFSLTIDQQLDANFAERITHVIENTGRMGYAFDEGDRLAILIESTLAVDTTNPNNRIQFTGLVNN